MDDRVSLSLMALPPEYMHDTHTANWAYKLYYTCHSWRVN